MGINGISDYSQLFQNYRIPEIPVADVKQMQQPAAVQPEAEAKKPVDIDLSIEENSPVSRKNADVQELSLTFNVNEDFGYIGQDSNLGNLDMQKAISDMKKDSILQQYQYFVGSAENLFPQSSSEDGAVFLKF